MLNSLIRINKDGPATTTSCFKDSSVLSDGGSVTTDLSNENQTYMPLGAKTNSCFIYNKRSRDEIMLK